LESYEKMGLHLQLMKISIEQGAIGTDLAENNTFFYGGK
jgi:hypothetical protein